MAAVRASDATGDEQVSWIVSAGGKTVIHAGDTMWHGAWWKTGKAHGPIDVAFLPVNGAVINFPWTQPPASAPAVLTPEQAVDATAALEAGRLVPIHYGDMHHDDFYRAHPDPEGAVSRGGGRARGGGGDRRSREAVGRALTPGPRPSGARGGALRDSGHV